MVSDIVELAEKEKIDTSVAEDRLVADAIESGLGFAQATQMLNQF